jgi:NAD+ synthase
MHQLEARVTETDLPLVYLNIVRGQDDSVVDGGSFVLKCDGPVAVQLPLFEEAVVHVDFR